MDAFEDFTETAPCFPFYFRQILSGPHENFHYVVGCTDTREACIIDPSFHLEEIFERATRDGFRITKALFTHGHWDHIGGIPAIFDLGVKEVYAHEAAGTHPKIQEAGAKATLLADEETFHVGTIPFRLLHTPGHQPEGSCFVTDTKPAALFGGDTLFIGTCGRTDFPGGDTEAMHASMQRMRQWPDDWVVFPGHHYHEKASRNLGEEKQGNPALTTTDLAEFSKLHCLTH
ncbi:MAG: MBL fold metallo-hydrolase [Thermoplasmatota archaeon]